MIKIKNLNKRLSDEIVSSRIILIPNMEGKEKVQKSNPDFYILVVYW
ncbi:MAG: hypothetical protein GXY91_00935 [Clostridia bacterium]|nr:hypothetical protein [Clostridia bacterium]